MKYEIQELPRQKERGSDCIQVETKTTTVYSITEKNSLVYLYQAEIKMKTSVKTFVMVESDFVYL